MQIDAQKGVGQNLDKRPVINSSHLSEEVKQFHASIAIPLGLKEGMAYGDLRNIVIASSWLPKPHPDCKRSVIGADFEKVCSSNPDLCKECDDIPELSECSGDGHCLMEFSDSEGRQVLTIATYGDIKDARIEGEKSGLRVSWWDAKSKK
ncbi:hypothetical protein KM539_13500 [Xanthomonas translucens pv. poae]|uniref:hypothetical protein n=1 Tax=Xanthomonas graminis TaxID=3390026 RepID=UPI001112E65B|nr:hypothetical protein [Xanthomonas translucens]UKE60830.1 hypothetical protein KM539_13500 [Xanthomonas translucens pv. poae]